MRHLRYPKKHTARGGIKQTAEKSTSSSLPYGLYYDSQFVRGKVYTELMSYLQGLHPIWEMRFSKSNPPPEGQPNRRLLRPVYWLGNWQFACLDYYHPPKGIEFRCVEAEPYPRVMAALVEQIQEIVHQNFKPQDIPRGWHLNTCLVNYYGHSITDFGKKDDTARVGEHKDFEPGPVGSISLGERALFQFVKSHGKGAQSQVMLQQWLEDGSLQIFGSDRFKKNLFHRVQRVEKKGSFLFDMPEHQFQTRRINLTFRYVPDEHVRPFVKFPKHLRDDIREYMTELAKHSDFFSSALAE